MPFLFSRSRTCACLAALILYATGLAASHAAYQHFEARQVHPLAMTPDGTRLVAVDSTNARVTVFDLGTGSPVKVAQIPVGLEPVTARVRTNAEAWIVNEVGDSVSIVNLTNNTITDTLKVGDEPTDVVFAAGKAFVTCARDNQIRVFNAETRAAAGTISLSGLYPHALAVNADGTRLYAAFLHSGNRTTVIKREVAPPQSIPTNPNLPAPPDTALIVAASDPRVNNTILDRDVAEIDTTTLGVLRYVSDVGTNLFDLAARPGSDQIWVTNTEALNLTPFEPALRGHFADNRLSVVTPAAVTVVDLNPGINYSTLPNPSAQTTALAQPTSLVFSADGSALWVAAFASDRIAKIDPVTGEVLARVDIRPGADSSFMRGPRGLVLDEPRERLYVLNKLSNTITVIDTAMPAVLVEREQNSYDPMPRAVRMGRGFLFDARLSGNGTMSCGTCHIDADRDGLAWDLGDPGGEMMTVLGANLSVHDLTPRPRVMHPMKGPMVTQTLRGMQTGAPFHWRGDKPTLQSFNPTFANLMGGSQVPGPHMDDLAEYLFSLVHHSNPNRNLDRSLPTNLPGSNGNPANGRLLYNNHAKSHCAVCHLLPEGSDHNIDLPQESGLSQPVKTPPLRTIYQRMFFDARAGTTSLSGFGMLHDGTGGSASLPTVHPYVLDQLETLEEFADVTAFIRCFDTGTAKTVGYARTATAANRADSAVTADLSLLEARASANPADCDLIVRGKINGADKAFGWTGTAYQGETQAAGTLTRAALLASLSGSDSLTFLGVLPGLGARMSVDEDEDTVLNGDDPEPGVVNGPPKITGHPQTLAVAPGQPASFTVVAEGTDLNYQWKRGTTNVGVNSATYNIAAASTADNGSYTCVVSNTFGSRTSDAATLNVVPPPLITKQPVSRTVNEGANVSFSVTATGSNLSYQWKRGTTNVGGGDKATLTLAGVGEQDVSSYSVVISNGDTEVTSDTVSLTVNLKPVMADLNLPAAIIGQDYIWQLSAANGPTKFNVTNLPAGLKISATGLITGKPTTAKSYLVKASATNATGTGGSKEQTLVVQPYPAEALGVYLGTVPRNAELTLTNNLGGRITLTSTKLGAFSGSLVIGTVTHPLSGKLVMLPDTDPAGSLTITRKGLSSLTLAFTLQRSTRRLIGTVGDGTRSLDLTAFLPEDVPAGFAGNYTLALKQSANGNVPRGHSVGAFKITAKGAVSGVIRLADGTTAVTLSGVVGEGGNLPVFTLLYAKLGSLLGTINIGSAGVLDASSMGWFKHPQAKVRSYPDGFGPLALTAIGRPYVIPLLNGIAMGLPGGAGNARLVFAEGGAPDPATRLNWNAFEIQKGSPAKILPPTSNPGTVKLTVTPGTGTIFTAGTTGGFTGSFKLTDTDTSVTPNKPLSRTTTFTGMIVDDGSGQKGYGFFNLAEMPTAIPKTTATTTKMLSGTVELGGPLP
ncbi:MAG: immunoglobulin domain-containing protein [Verrucomicrobiota bacterium]